MRLDQYAIGELLLKRKKLRREFHALENLSPIRIAVLGGSTTNELVDLWELQLLEAGFRPDFYQSEYGRFYEEAVFETDALLSFRPDLVYIHTSYQNVQALPSMRRTEAELEALVESEVQHYAQVWQSLENLFTAQIIQNNFELPPQALFGNLDSVISGGPTRFFNKLNERFAEEAGRKPRLLLHDIHRLSTNLGLSRWFDPVRWYSYKLPVTPEASLSMAHSLTSIVRAIYGQSRKVLVLDLDNTLWGGVIGDDGVHKIQLGHETALAEAYLAFQAYCLQLHGRGILLAVCSKNDEAIARQGFLHPASLLKLEHFSAFKANWEQKHENIMAIAAELNLGVESFVFVDDNPAERAIVEAQIPGIAVPDVGSDVTQFASTLDAARYFEQVAVSQEDLLRATLYQDNASRNSSQAKFATYGEYLDSLDMTAEIARFSPVYLDRIAQLTNKTNQFNLTTRRYTLAQIEACSKNEQYLGLYGRLADRFGDNGLISVVLGRKESDALHIDLWLMSCRVLKRDMELAMLDAIAANARAMQVRTLIGVYIPTKKNAIVAEHYSRLGFIRTELDQQGGASTWTLNLASYTPRNRHIKLAEPHYQLAGSLEEQSVRP